MILQAYFAERIQVSGLSLQLVSTFQHQSRTTDSELECYKPSEIKIIYTIAMQPWEFLIGSHDKRIIF